MTKEHAEPRFGTDGVRGVANENLTAPFALRLGIAAAHVLMSRSDRESGGRVRSKQRTCAAPGHVVVGRDTRLSGDMLEAALNAGLAATGCRVTNVGVVPTPAVSHIVVRLGATAGAIISASHNPYPDNGIKFIGPDGRKLPDAIEEQIADALGSIATIPRPTGPDIGRIAEAEWHGQSAYGSAPVLGYIAHVAATAGAPLDGFKLVLDCANGATAAIAPGLFADLGADVVAMAASPDGVNINRDCGSTSPQAMCAKVVEIGVDAGLAFDGDGDRVMMCDERGAIVDGDRMMAICAIGMKRRGELEGNLVVATIMSNAGLDAALELHGIELRRTDVGDRYVAEEMARSGAVLGGEQSGHLLFGRLTLTGDGMLSGLQVLKEMRASGIPLSALAGVMPTYPQVLRNVRVADRNAWRSDPAIARAIEQARARLERPEWLSVRPSGTEPLVRVMAQGPDEAVVREAVDGLCAMIANTSGGG